MNIEGMPEHQRLATLASLEARRPGASSLVAGTLAGPATADRPNIPVWCYAHHAETHPDIRLEDLLQVRFPVIFHGGTDFTITSVAERLRTDPLPPSVPVTVDSVLDEWTGLHAAGFVRWDSERRAVEHLRSLADYRALLNG